MGELQHGQSIVLTPDGDSGAGQTAKLWDVTTGQELATLEGHKSSITSVSFSLDSTMMATSSYDTTVRLWVAATSYKVDAQK
jgi:WD40 repeat protein